MSLLFRVIYHAHCRSTHHKLVMNALHELSCESQHEWRDFFLAYHNAFLEGAKAPDTKFKDFRNHVLHVSQNYWGGACDATEEWYAITVRALRLGEWREAAFAAGVMSHYYTDPIMPFHTGQSEAENNIHRAAEWSVTRSYDELRELYLERMDRAHVSAGTGNGWVAELVKRGAEESHAYYQTFIEHYDFERGRANPPEGLDETCRRFLAWLIGYSAAGFATLLSRALEESNVSPPGVSLTLSTFLATLEMPIRYVTKQIADARERKLVEAMYEELQRTGRVEETLPEDDRSVREHVRRTFGDEAVKGIPRKPQAAKPFRQPVPAAVLATSKRPPFREASQPAKPITPTQFQLPKPVSSTQVTQEPETTYTRPKPRRPSQPEVRYHLRMDDDIEEAPSIGPKTAVRFYEIGIETIAEFLAGDPHAMASEIEARHITPQAVEEWQCQARLMTEVAELRCHDAQIIVGCGIRSKSQLTRSDGHQLLQDVLRFVRTSKGQRILRSGKVPDRREVDAWIQNARAVRIAA